VFQHPYFLRDDRRAAANIRRRASGESEPLQNADDDSGHEISRLRAQLTDLESKHRQALRELDLVRAERTQAQSELAACRAELELSRVQGPSKGERLINSLYDVDDEAIASGRKRRRMTEELDPTPLHEFSSSPVFSEDGLDQPMVPPSNPEFASNNNDTNDDDTISVFGDAPMGSSFSGSGATDPIFGRAPRPENPFTSTSSYPASFFSSSFPTGHGSLAKNAYSAATGVVPRVQASTTELSSAPSSMPPPLSLRPPSQSAFTPQEDTTPGGFYPSRQLSSGSLSSLVEPPNLARIPSFARVDSGSSMVSHISSPGVGSRADLEWPLADHLDADPTPNNHSSSSSNSSSSSSSNAVLVPTQSAEAEAEASKIVAAFHSMPTSAKGELIRQVIQLAMMQHAPAASRLTTSDMVSQATSRVPPSVLLAALAKFEQVRTVIRSVHSLLALYAQFRIDETVLA
jgi:hypothetical protein